MFVHYLKISLRNLIKHRGITFINIFGLAVGMACAILIFLWVEQQLSYDRWQVNRDRIYRLESESWVVMPPYLNETAKAFPEVEHGVRFYFWVEPTLKYKDNIFTVTEFALVDSTVFNVFNFDFIAGTPRTALINPHSIVLTESISKRLFRDEYPLGKMILMNNEYEYTVTGVVEDVEKFHMNINAFVSVTDITRSAGNNSFLTDRNYNFSIYLLIVPGADIPHLVDKINDRAKEIDRYRGDRLLLRPYNDIYFANHLQHEKNTKHGNIHLVVGFSVIAVLILGIACINFINLTVAKTSTREKEIAMRKVSGAAKSSIQKQFFGETFIIVFISFLFAMLLVTIFLPDFRNLTGEQISLTSLNFGTLPIIVGVLFFTAFVSGIYPSFYLSILEPVIILRGKSGKVKKSAILSKILMGFQFAISIFLIISTLTVIRQLHYMQNTDLGIDHDQVLTCTLRGDKFQGDSQKLLSSKSGFKERLVTNPAIKGVTFLNQLPGKITNTWGMYVTDAENSIPIRVINADPDFVELMGIEITEGRNLSYNIPTDLNRAFLLNEAAVKQLELEDPVHSAATVYSGRSPIVGVVKDFHYNSLHTSIGPMAIMWNYGTNRACIKITGGNIRAAVNHIGTVFQEFCPGFAFEYEFLDESFGRQYASEKRLEEILKVFVSLAICLSCLGLFALTAFVAEQKTKEIGIRKVLGSTNTGILFLLSKSFVKWIILANIVSWPVAYVILDRWLRGFAYHINISIFIFFIGGSLALLIALLTVGYRALKAASTNPIESLRYE